MEIPKALDLTIGFILTQQNSMGFCEFKINLSPSKLNCTCDLITVYIVFYHCNSIRKEGHLNG